jgi:hypothetical protein
VTEHNGPADFSTVALCLVLIVAVCQAMTPINVVADWKSYSNRDFGFTLRYSKDFTLCAGGLDYCEVTSRSYVPVCDDNVVDCLVYTGKEYEGTNFEGAALSVNVLRDRRTEQDCNELDIGQNPTKTKVINGVRFHYGMAGYGGLGHWVGRAKYRALYDKVCFELAVNVAGVNSANFEPGTIKEFDESKLDKQLDATVNSFRFTGPVVDGSAWRSYHNEDVGGTFEYPDRDTVVKSIEYSMERQSSNEITDSAYFSDDGLNYFVSTKVGLRDKDALDAWLRQSGYPDLNKAQELRRSSLFTEYKVGNYWYVFGQAALYILGASDQQHNVVAPPDNVVFRHFLHSFKPN